ncbi:PASTA domain-containing protein [Streptomyces purpurogeneiscleroticus]|uniref:PASTA domain-containing protein n=1 Tax=Streptomyces purpurogeneiscleroticus TaxID=68259 RepID=UPI001CC02BC1|nr:PASTA domain-containing protein [Streptomyces purpurogeneiscleroticus]
MNPYSPPTRQTPPARPWWKTTPAALGLLVLVALIGAFHFPLGFLALIVAIVLLWVLPPWRWFARLGASFGAFILLTIGAGLGGQLDDTGKGETQQVATESRTASPKASPSRTPERKAPDYIGELLDEAEGKARAAGYTVSHHDASAEGRAIIARSGWLVCFQQSDHDDSRRLIDFAAVKDGETCPKKDGEEIPWPTMPELHGKTWQAAVETLTGIGVDEDAIQAEAYYVNDDLPDGAYDSWRVCTQDPAEGEDITADVTLELVHPKAGCSTDDLYLSDKDDDGRPDYRDSTDDRNTTSGGGSGGNGSSASGGSSSSGGGSSSTGGTSSGGSSSTGGSTGGGGLTVHPGSFCAPAGATGVTSAGTPMVCGPGSDGRNRWRSA